MSSGTQPQDTECKARSGSGPPGTPTQGASGFHWGWACWVGPGRCRPTCGQAYIQWTGFWSYVIMPHLVTGPLAAVTKPPCLGRQGTNTANEASASPRLMTQNSDGDS